MPVAIAPIDPQARPTLSQFAFQRGDERAVLIVDRGSALEVIIVLGDREYSLWGNVPAAQHIFEKGNDVFTTLRSAKGDHQQRIIIAAFAHVLFPSLTRRAKIR